MKLQFPLLEQLYRIIRNIILLAILVFFLQYIFAGISFNLTLRYNDIPKHKYAREQVKYNWLQVAGKVLGYAKQIKDIVL